MGIDRSTVVPDELVLGREVDKMNKDEKYRMWSIARLYFQRELFKLWIEMKKHSDIDDMDNEAGRKLLVGLEKAEVPIMGKAFADVMDKEYVSDNELTEDEKVTKNKVDDLKDEIVEEYFRWLNLHKRDPSEQDSIFGQELFRKVFEKITE